MLRTMTVSGTSEVTLWTSETGSARLRVTLSQPGVAKLTETSSGKPYLRVFRITGLKAGHAMLEAKSARGDIQTHIQIVVTCKEATKMRAIPNGSALLPVSSMSIDDKVKEALQRSIPLLPTEAREQIEAMLTPESLAIIAGTLVIWAGSHFFGVGEIVDVILLVIGFALLGPAVWTTATELYEFGKQAISAKTQGDLNSAAEHFAKAVVVGGITIITAVLLRSNVGAVRARGGVTVKPGWVQEAGPPPPMQGRLFHRPGISQDPTLPAGTGETSMFGDITVSSRGSPIEQSLARHHEWIHSILSPKFALLRQLRANLKASGYVRSALLQYLEEAMAESYALLRVRGIAGLIDGIRFPVAQNYVTITALKAEGIAIGSIVFGGRTFTVYLQ